MEGLIEQQVNTEGASEQHPELQCVSPASEALGCTTEEKSHSVPTSRKRLVTSCQNKEGSWPESGPWTNPLTERQKHRKRAFLGRNERAALLLVFVWATVFSFSQRGTNTFFTAGPKVALNLGPHLDASITSRWRRGRVLPSFPQAATSTRHGRSRKPTPLFGVQASLLDRVPCTLIRVLCRRHTFLDRSRGPVPFDGPDETAGPHKVNVCESKRSW